MALEESSASIESHTSSSASLTINLDPPLESSSNTSKLNAQAPAFVPGRVYATRTAPLHQITTQFLYAPQLPLQSPPSPYYAGVARRFVDQEVAAADADNSTKNGGLTEEAAQKIVNQVFKSLVLFRLGLYVFYCL